MFDGLIKNKKVKNVIIGGVIMRQKKIVLFMVSSLLLLSITGCKADNQDDKIDVSTDQQVETTNPSLEDNNSENTAEQNPAEESVLEHESGFYDQIYSVALDAIMPVEDSLNQNMAYIAVDTDTLVDATDEDIASIINSLTKYNVEVIEASFDTLKSKDMVKDGNALDGVLLKISSVKIISEDKIEIIGSKYRSGVAAIGVKCELINAAGEWIIGSSEIVWVS